MSLLRAPCRRLGLALLTSILLHGTLIGVPKHSATPHRPTALEVRLPAPLDPAEPNDDVLKDTFAEVEHIAPKNVVASPPRTNARSAAASRVLARHVYYPPDAVAAGLEGDVRLLLTLEKNGKIVDVAIAASSGHEVLDRAAERAAWAMGKVSGSSALEMLLPVTFRLR